MKDPKAWLGCTTKVDEGRLTVTQVARGTPAYDAGISPEDEILGIDNYRVRPDQWNLRLQQYRPHEQISLLISRRERLLTIPIELAEEPARSWVLGVDPAAKELQKQHLMSWLQSHLASVRESTRPFAP